MVLDVTRKQFKKHARLMVLVHETSSKCVIQMYEVSMKYLKFR